MSAGLALFVSEGFIPTDIKIPGVARTAGAWVVLVLASCLCLAAQNVVLMGAIAGRVTDRSGAVVPGASVVVRNLATGVQQSAETDHLGLYQFPAVMPGTYSVLASNRGFRPVE